MPLKNVSSARSLCAFLAIVLLVGAGAAQVAAAQTTPAAPPKRVVSLNLCTDQLAMLIAEPGQLISVSHLAQRPDASTMSERAAAYPANRGRAEEIFLLNPDLVLAGVFTAHATTDMLRRLGYRVEAFEPENSFSDIRANIRRMGALLGRQARAAELLAEFDARLAAARATEAAHRPRLALYYANGYSSGAGTLADEVAEAAGFTNIARAADLSGTLKLPLEKLVMASPEAIVGHTDSPGRAYENYRHPALRQAAKGALLTGVSDKYWVCGGPFTAEAVRMLSAARVRLSP